MTTNRLAKSNVPSNLTAEQWCERGNAQLKEIGRAHELQWNVRDGRPKLEPWSAPIVGRTGA